VGQLGMWGFLICGAQAAGLEHNEMKAASWTAGTSQLSAPHVLFRITHSPSRKCSWFIDSVYLRYAFLFPFRNAAVAHVTLGLRNSDVDSVHGGPAVISYGLLCVL